ncbi:MAG: hypothetical protein AAB820_00610 [Patescibacteria group bacterium]
MLKKLKSASKSLRAWQLISALKAVIFAGLLFLSVIYWLFTVIFLIVALYFYFRPTINAGRFLFSFLALLAISLLVVKSLAVGLWLSVIGLFFGFLLFLLLGIKNLSFVHRQPLYYLYGALMFLTIFAVFFNADKSGLFTVKYLAVGLAIFLIFREFLGVIEETESISGLSIKKNLYSLVFAFLVLEFIWVVALLPLGFLNAASFAILFALVLEDLIIHHFGGTLNRLLILRNVTVFLILTVAIFGASVWIF